MGEDFRQSCPEFVGQLMERKLDNSACLAVEVEFCEGEEDCSITHAELIFGSKLKAVPGENKKTNNKKKKRMKRLSAM
jgi:hypothetical protein